MSSYSRRRISNPREIVEGNAIKFREAALRADNDYDRTRYTQRADDAERAIRERETDKKNDTRTRRELRRVGR